MGPRHQSLPWHSLMRPSLLGKRACLNNIIRPHWDEGSRLLTCLCDHTSPDPRHPQFTWYNSTYKWLSTRGDLSTRPLHLQSHDNCSHKPGNARILFTLFTGRLILLWESCLPRNHPWDKLPIGFHFKQGGILFYLARIEAPLCLPVPPKWETLLYPI